MNVLNVKVPHDGIPGGHNLCHIHIYTVHMTQAVYMCTYAHHVSIENQFAGRQIPSRPHNALS